MSEHEIRPFASMDDYRACVALQEETWGEGFSERVSMAILKVSQILGGVAAGAFANDGTLEGFVFGMTGPRNGRVVHWSDMLAVRPGIRDAGLGRRLKAYQREVLLEAGVDLMHWTFDPLQSRNAHLNFAKLGIVVREYRVDMYGDSDSPLHRGIGTDRFVAYWPMASERVERRLRDQAPPASMSEAATPALDASSDGTEGGIPHPTDPVLDLEDPVVRIAIPADLEAVRAESLAVAVAWRHTTRAAFQHYLDRGYEVREFFRGPWASHYVLTADHDPTIPSKGTP